jgi:hypothetical protein
MERVEHVTSAQDPELTSLVEICNKKFTSPTELARDRHKLSRAILNSSIEAPPNFLCIETIPATVFRFKANRRST